jgi:hypothetical protein
MSAQSAGDTSAATTTSFDAGRPATRGEPMRGRRAPTRWERRTFAFGRYAVLAIPVFALIAGLLPRSADAVSLDPATFAAYLVDGRWSVRESIASVGLVATGVVSIVGLAALLFRGRARWFAVPGLILGLVGSAGMVAGAGSLVVRDDRLRHAVFGGWSAFALNAAHTGATTARLVEGGAILLTLGWILLGIGVSATSGMYRADGPLLIISAPLVFLGGMVLHVLPTMGSFLLLAAGLGIPFVANRIAIAGDMTRAQQRHMEQLAGQRIASGPTRPSGDALDRAPGLAGSLGLVRPFPPTIESRVAKSAVYRADTVTPASAADGPDATTPAATTPADTTPADAAPITAGHNGHGTADPGANGHVPDGTAVDATGAHSDDVNRGLRTGRSHGRGPYGLGKAMLMRRSGVPGTGRSGRPARGAPIAHNGATPAADPTVKSTPPVTPPPTVKPGSAAPAPKVKPGSAATPTTRPPETGTGTSAN